MRMRRLFYISTALVSILGGAACQTSGGPSNSAPTPTPVVRSAGLEGDLNIALQVGNYAGTWEPGGLVTELHIEEVSEDRIIGIYICDHCGSDVYWEHPFDVPLYDGMDFSINLGNGEYADFSAVGQEIHGYFMDEDRPSGSNEWTSTYVREL